MKSNFLLSYLFLYGRGGACTKKCINIVARCARQFKSSFLFVS